MCPSTDLVFFLHHLTHKHDFPTSSSCFPSCAGSVYGFRVGVVQGRRHPPHLAPAPRPRHRQQAAVPAVGGRHLRHAARLSSPKGICRFHFGSSYAGKSFLIDKKGKRKCWLIWNAAALEVISDCGNTVENCIASSKRQNPQLLFPSAGPPPLCKPPPPPPPSYPPPFPTVKLSV